MKFRVLLLIFSTLGIFAKDVTKIHDWVQKNIQSLEKFIQETDMSSDILLGVQKNDQGKNYQNWIFSTNHKQHIELTGGQVMKTNAFGPESEYFTEITQNLVFLGTQIKDKEWMKIQMKISDENVERIDMFTKENYQGVSLINSNNQVTMNRLLIVEKNNEIISSYEEHGKSIISISNLSENQFLFYILYSQNSEVGDIEKLFNYIVKNVIDLEKETEIKEGEEPVKEDKEPEPVKEDKELDPIEFDDGEEEVEPNGPLEKLEKTKNEEEDGEENDKESEEQHEDQKVEEENHEGVPEEDCPGGEEDDTVKNKVDVDSTTQLPSQQDPKSVKIQTTEDVVPEENVEIVEESEEEELIVPQKSHTVGGKSSLPPKQNEEDDENSEPEPPSEEYQNCAGEELDTVKNKRDLNKSLESKQERVFQAKEMSIKETIQEEEGEGDGKPDGTDEGKTNGTDEVKTDGTDAVKTDGTDEVKTDGTDAVKTDGTDEVKTDGTDEVKTDGTDAVKTDGTDEGKTDGTDAVKTDGADAVKTDGTDAVKTEGTDEGKTDGTDEGKTDEGKSEGTDGKTEGDVSSTKKPENDSSKSEQEEPCVILYSECHYTGDELKLCGAHPVIPNDMKNFKVKSIKVPEGVQVTFFNKPNFDDERLHAKTEMECLETPLRLNLLELMNNLRMSKQVNINSISVTK